MSADEFQQLWKAYDSKLEKSLALSHRLFIDMQQQKVSSELRPLLRSRVVGIVAGIIWLALMGLCLYFVRSQPVMAISFGVFCICTALGIAGYVRDVSVIHAIGYVGNVVDTQRKLAGMQNTMIRDLRLAWLQMPFWSVFFVSNAFIKNTGRAFYFVELPIFLVFVGLAIFLYTNLTLENTQRKKWVAAMVRGAGSRRVARALDLLKELDEFEREG